MSLRSQATAAFQVIRDEFNARQYGREFNLLQALAVTTNTTTTLTDKINSSVTLNTPGDYKITVSFAFNVDSNTTDFVANFLFDGVSVSQDAAGEIVRLEGKDNAGNFQGTASNQKNAFCQTFFLQGVTAGTKTVQLRYAPEIAGVEASMWDASIEVIRVA